MITLTTLFTCAAGIPAGVSLTWLILMALALSDDAAAREKRERRDKRRRDKAQRPKPPRPPTP